MTRDTNPTLYLGYGFAGGLGKPNPTGPALVPGLFYCYEYRQEDIRMIAPQWYMDIMDFPLTIPLIFVGTIGFAYWRGKKITEAGLDKSEKVGKRAGISSESTPQDNH